MKAGPSTEQPAHIIRKLLANPTRETALASVGYHERDPAFSKKRKQYVTTDKPLTHDGIDTQEVST